ncbi:MAG: deoxyribodipyrimidine photolyase [Rhizobiales bacterium 65-9]|nr:deoxyribodipyrimidine photo-lyase [Hyphomicrobiales bacterium]OJY35353.1 MAG: deoxyribodipyrimidine photolyase [Rhizobiales bacterium 65-9]
MIKGEPAGHAIVWLRRDLRIADNPALHAAVESGAPVACLFILEEGRSSRAIGAAARWWLHGSLETLARNLDKRGGRLVLLRGDPLRIFTEICAAAKPTAAFWDRRYDAPGIEADMAIKAMLTAQGVRCESFNGSLLNEPWEVKSAAGGPMRVFTPYWKAARARLDPAQPLAAPRRINGAPWPDAAAIRPVTLESLSLRPARPDWAAGFPRWWKPGEDGARERLAEFLDDSLRGYAQDRDRPARPATSRLSPHLAFGDISPRQIWSAARHHADATGGPGLQRDVEKFLAEIGWREFSYHLLFHNPDLATENFQKRFDALGWRTDGKALRAWRKGQTGYPIVDAGMRQLWASGWMHNRVRMVVASFLIKHLLIDWREGERWFWDTLADADAANNPASWQWVAGTGADAAPYFRIFNPVLQGEKFDPDGAYVREWVPELARMPDKFIHQPWKAPKAILAEAGVVLDKTYPAPIVDHAAARARALDAFAALKAQGSAEP